MTFDSEFDAALDGHADTFGNPKWSIDPPGTEWDAISIDGIDAATRAALGGRYTDATTTIFVKLSVFTASGVKDGDVVVVRGQRMRVIGIGNDGDGARQVYCGPAAVDLRR